MIRINAQPTEDLQASHLRDEALLRALDLSSDTLVQTDFEGLISCVSAGAYALLGCRPDELIGIDLLTFVHPDDRIRLAQSCRALRFGREQVACTYRTVHRDGRHIWTESTFRLVRDSATGSPREIAGMMRDISWRVAADNSPQGLVKLADVLIENVVDYAIFMLDLEGNVMSWNPGAQRMKGYYAQEIIGVNFAAFYTDEDVDRGEPQRALDVARVAGSFEAEGWRVRKDHSLFWANVIIDAVRNRSGELIGFAKVIRDVTQRLAERAAVAKASEDLRQRSNRRPSRRRTIR